MSPRPQQGKPTDPYGTPVSFDGRHAELADHEGVRVEGIPRDEPEDVARAAAIAQLDKLGARYGVPLVLILGLLSQLLDVL